MNPITNIQEVLKHWDYFERSEIPLFGFILYTDEDENTASYIAQNFWNLHALTGRYCTVFLIDKPSDPTDKGEAQKYLVEIIKRVIKKDPTAENLYSNIPYDKTQAYKIAEYLGISPDNLPCIAFFTNIYQNDIIIFQLNEKWTKQEFTKQFRNLFSVIQKTIGKLESEYMYPDDEEYQVILKNQLLIYIKKEAIKNKVELIITHPVTKTIAEVLKYRISGI